LQRLEGQMVRGLGVECEQQGAEQGVHGAVL
jgi:hypothetical protein